MKKKKEKKKKKNSNGGGRIWTRNLWITKLGPYHWANETTGHLQSLTLQNMYLYSIWRLGPYDLRPVQSHNSNFDLKKPY